MSELKRYRSILARRIARDITDTLSVDHDEQNRVEDEVSWALNFGYGDSQRGYSSEEAVIIGMTGSCCPGSTSCSNSRLAFSIFGYMTSRNPVTANSLGL